MRTWADDHPHLRSQPDVMSCDEIRYWINALTSEHGWGSHCLTRTLGLHNPGSMMSKLKRSWIFPSEQIRLSRQLKRIISGELICVSANNRGKASRLDAVVADNPVPLQRPARLAYDFSTGRLRWVRPHVGTAPVLPSFATALQNLEVWEP